jgi:hypothetical protein
MRLSKVVQTMLLGDKSLFGSCLLASLSPVLQTRYAFARF